MLGSRRRSLQSNSPSPSPAQRRSGSRSNGILVIGNDSVGNRVANQLDDIGGTIFVGLGDSPFDSPEESDPLTLEIDRITDLFEADFDITPTTAIVATSEDSQNLLIVSHLREKFDIDHIVVRVNEPQNIEVFADLSVDLVDVASIVGSVLTERLDPSRNTQ